MTAVVVSFNSVADLPACLDALLAQDHAGLDVVAVDNASVDGSREVLAHYASTYAGRVRVVASDVNRGFAGGVNDALALATDADAVLLANPDAVARPDHVRRLVAVLAAHPDCGAVQGKLLRPPLGRDGPPTIDSAGHAAFRPRLFRNRGEGEADDGRWDTPAEVFGVSGALALYRRTMLDDVALVRPGGTHEVLDEDLFAYFEDVDLDWRARLRGWHARYAPDAVGVHARGGASPDRSDRVEALNWRNRLLVVAACDHLGSLAVAAPQVVLTTLLKTAELVLTRPGALPTALRRADLAWLRAKRRQLRARATVAPAQVVADWFGPFDYRRWVAQWWRQVRSAARG